MPPKHKNSSSFRLNVQVSESFQRSVYESADKIALTPSEFMRLALVRLMKDPSPPALEEQRRIRAGTYMDAD